MIIELIVLTAFLVFLLVLLFTPHTHKCPKCGGMMKESFIDCGCTVYKCEKCGEYQI